MATQPLAGPLPTLRFRWDVETEILSGRFAPPDGSRGFTGSIDLQGRDGAFVTLEVERGTLCGVEVAVWPDVESRTALRPPDAEPGRLTMPARPSEPGIGAVEVETALTAEASVDGAVIHFAVGATRDARAVRVATDFLIEMDRRDRIAGFWLLHVPPFPEAA